MLGLLVLLLVAASVSLLGEALAPRGMSGGVAGTIFAGTLGAAQAAVIVVLLFTLVAQGFVKSAPKQAKDKPVTLTLRVKKAEINRMT